MTIKTDVIDKNGLPVLVGQKVRMHYFSIGCCNGGAVECENEVIGIVRVRGYRRNGDRLFCVQTADGRKYAFELMQEPSEEIEIITNI